MNEISVLIIDPNVMVRLALSNIIRESENINISGAFDSSEIQDPVTFIQDNKTSAVILGIDKMESREMELFLLIRKSFPALPIFVITPLCEEGAVIALRALKNGAADYITRPVNRTGIFIANKHLVKRLIPLLEAVPRLNLKFAGTLPEHGKQSEWVTHSMLSDYLKPVEIVVVSGCTGGVQALYPLISSFPNNMSAPVIIVQHMPKIYTTYLARELDWITPLNVQEARNNCLLKAGNIYVVPGGFHAEVKNSRNQKLVQLHRGSREQKNRPSADVLIRSICQEYHNKALYVVLSGSGLDGFQGACDLAGAGSQVILQNRDSSLLWDLPKKIAETGSFSGIFHPARIGLEISLRVKAAREQPSFSNDKKKIFSIVKWPASRSY